MSISYNNNNDKDSPDSMSDHVRYQHHDIAAKLPQHASSSDQISQRPVTTQPTVLSAVYSTPWTYIPSGPLPLERAHFHGSSTTVCSDSKVNGKYQQDSNEVGVHPKTSSRVTVSREPSSVPSAGSRDWSRGLLGSFLDVRKSTEKMSALKIFVQDCCCIPCMMCSMAKSLGDKPYLPFLPGTGAAIRFKIRILGGIEGSIANDCLVTSCCCPCAVCQMYKEIDDIGLAPT